MLLIHFDNLYLSKCLNANWNNCLKMQRVNHYFIIQNFGDLRFSSTRLKMVFKEQLIDQTISKNPQTYKMDNLK